MLDYVREGDNLYIESIMRLGCSTKDLLNIIDTLTEKGVTLVSHKEKIDTDTPSGKFMLTVFAALSQLERKRLKERSLSRFGYMILLYLSNIGIDIPTLSISQTNIN